MSMSLAQLGEISKAHKEYDDSHMGRKLFGTGVAASLGGSALHRQGSRRFERALEGQDIYTSNPQHGLEAYHERVGKLPPGLKRATGGKLLASSGGTLATLGIGAGIANITHKRRTMARAARQERARAGARTRDRNMRIERALGAR